MSLETKTPTADAFAVIISARQVINAWNTKGGLKIENAHAARRRLERALDALPPGACPVDVPAPHWISFLNTVERVLGAEGHELGVAIQTLTHATNLVSVDRSPPPLPEPAPDPVAHLAYVPGRDD